MAVFFSFFVLLGFYGLYWKSQRAFNRRNSAGIEEFDSYFQSVLFKIFEGLVGILSVIGIGLGFALACIAYASKGWLFPFDTYF